MAQLKDTIVSGSLRATDTLYSTTSQFNILKIPTASGGTTYGVGSNGQIPITNGISVYWGNNVSITGNAATATKAGVSTIWMYPENNNEINFGGSNNGTTIYFGYRAKDSRAIPVKFIFGGSTGTADLQAKTVYLGSGTSSYVSSSDYTGNAASATKLKTARSINGTNFDGTANIITDVWGAARNVYITDDTTSNLGSAVSVNGGSNVILKLPTIIKATLDGDANNAKNTQSNFGAKSFIVEGDANTYYPTLFTNCTSHYAWTLLNISRAYGEQAPDTWNNSTHKGGLTLTILTNGDTNWGGNHSIGVQKLNAIIDLCQNYCTMVGDIQCTNFGLVIWLRGGSAKYWVTSNGGQSVSVTTYYEEHTQSSNTVAPRTDVNTTRINDYRWTNLWNINKANQLVTARTLTVGNTGKTFDGTANVSWSKSEILGSGTTAQFYRGDHTWSDTISGGTLKITNQSTTLTLGAQNTSWVHFTNSAGRLYYFDQQINAVDGFKVYNTTTALTNNNLTFAQGGGWYMSDSTWIRTVGSKSVYMNTGTFRNDGTTQLRTLQHVNANIVADGTWTTGATGTANSGDGNATRGTLGTSILAVGNNTARPAAGTAGGANNAQGYLHLYSEGTGYGVLTGYTTSARTHIHAATGLSVPENIVGIMFRPGSGSYYTHFSYETDGNEALVMATQNVVTSFIFINGESYANVSSSRWKSLTPALQIKNNSISIGKLIASGTTPTYKFYVNGTSMLVNKVYLGESTTTTAPTNAGICVHDTRDVSHLPNTFGDQTVQWYFDNGTDDTGRGAWSTIMHLKGWTSSYAAHQLSFNADENNDDGSIYHRSGFNNVWASWDKPTVAGGTVSRVWRLLLDDVNISTAETSPFRLTTISKSLTPTQEWVDTGIAGANIPMSGSYIVQIYTNANDSAAMAHWHEYYTGIMSWYSDETNSIDADEIVLHKAGHASNGQNLYLRTIRTTTGNGGLKLQIKASKTCTAAGTYVFKFRRVI